jgi:alkylation response protein AidB-like acyl-CoA dehydrogenase
VDFAVTPLTSTESALQQEVRAFLDETLGPGHRPGLGIAAPHDPEFSRTLAARGWVGMAVPEEYGGHNRSAVERFIVTEELMAAGAPIGAHYVADRQTAPTILRFGTEAQRRRFLPAIVAGTCYFSLGMSEPDAGSDLASVRTVARREPGGWRLTGTKVWTSNAHLNQYMVVLCRSSPAGDDRHAGLSQVIIDLTGPGVSVRPLPYVDGSHHFNEVVLDSVRVNDDMVLGEPGQGWDQVTAELGYERSGPDRYLSTFPVVRELVGALARSEGHLALRSDAVHSAIGAITARLWAIRRMSLSIARSLDSGAAPAVEAALVKDLGTTFEQESIELMRRAADMEVDPTSPRLFDSLLAECIITGPIFTLRGGTTEILRSIAAKQLRP